MGVLLLQSAGIYPKSFNLVLVLLCTYKEGFGDGNFVMCCDFFLDFVVIESERKTSNNNSFRIRD